MRSKGPSKDNVVTASTPLSQAIVACLSKGPFGLGDQVNHTNTTIVMAASRDDGWILQPSRTVTPIDRSYTSPSELNGGQIWIADSHVGGFARPWFHVLGIGPPTKDIALISSDFYSETKFSGASGEAPAWDGDLSHHFAYPWNHACLRGSSPTSCPPGVFTPASKAFIAGSGSADDAVHMDSAGQSMLKNTKEGYEYLQVAPILGDSSTILLGEVSKFVPFSPVRFVNITAAGGAYSLLVKGKVGESVRVTCACAKTAQLHQSSVVIGKESTATLILLPSKMCG